MNGVDVAQLHAKAAAAGWAVALFMVTPRVLEASLGSVLVLVMTGLTFAGAVVSSIGLIMAARDPEQDPVRLRRDLARSLRGLGVEVVGLALMMTGIALYWLTQAVLSFGPEGDQRVALTVFAYLTASMVIGRVAAVQHRRRKEARLAAAIGGTT